jgi:deazaflavin-dependent oxidoreductase (nitroreductase family)
MTDRTRLWPLRHFVTQFINPITRVFAGRVPGFGVLTCEGRTTGRTYQTPINLFRRGDHYVFMLTYGSDAEWVKNVLAAGGCSIRVQGRDVILTQPELIVDPRRRLVPVPIRFIGRLLNVTEFLRMRSHRGVQRKAA